MLIRANRSPHTKSIIYLARAIGAARSGDAARARGDVDRLAALKDLMKDAYWAEQIEIQRRAAAAWTARAEGKGDEASALMGSAVELGESTETQNNKPGPIGAASETNRFLELDAGR